MCGGTYPGFLLRLRNTKDSFGSLVAYHDVDFFVVVSGMVVHFVAPR